MQKIKLGALFALCASLIASANVSADGDNILTVNADVTTKISLILSQEQMNFTFEDGAFQSGGVTITGSTNSSRGYKISVQANLPYTELKHQKVTILDNIPAIAEPMQSSAFPESGWGYSTDATLFKPLTIEPATAFETAVNGRVDHTFTTGIKASTTLPAGIYTNELLFSIVANPTATSLEMAYEDSGAERVTVGDEQYFTMQDMTPEICAMADDIPSEIQAVDVRDNKLYWITKLADGHCWMTQNLDLDIDQSVTLTADTTNFKTIDSWTPSNESMINKDTTVGVFSNKKEPFVYDPGDMYGYSNRQPRSYPFEESGTHGHLGNLYTWAAAVATNDASIYVEPTNIPPNSICPKGWRLPTLSKNDYRIARSDNEYGRLNYLYNEGLCTTNAGLISAPLYFTMPGLSFGYYGNYSYAGSWGHYWTSTFPSRENYESIYTLQITPTMLNGTVDLTDPRTDSRSDGNSIRCIAE